MGLQSIVEGCSLSGLDDFAYITKKKFVFTVSLHSDVLITLKKKKKHLFTRSITYVHLQNGVFFHARFNKELRNVNIFKIIYFYFFWLHNWLCSRTDT